MRERSAITAQDRAALSAAIEGADDRARKIFYETCEAGDYVVIQGREADDTISFAQHEDGYWGALDLYADELATGDSIAEILTKHPEVPHHASPVI